MQHDDRIDYDQALTVTSLAKGANISGIHPHAQFFYELKCTKRMIQRLSTYVHVNGKEGFDNKPSTWKYVPPEGSAATCPQY